MDDFERGRLPRICAMTGEPGADVRWNLTGESPARGQVLLLFFGILPYVVVRAITRKTASGSVWVTERALTGIGARRRRQDRLRLIVGLAGLGLVVAGAFGFALLTQA